MLTRDKRPVLESSTGLSGRGWWLGCALVLIGALLATVPTVGDIGLTWDEPSYRTSQLVSAHWWEGLAKARSRADIERLTTPEALLFYWPYARFGYNFHPPLAGQLSLLTNAIFGRWMRDIPSRRMASVIEYAFTITLAFGFMARRYGAWAGAIAAGSLLTIPRVYGDGHIAGTDTPGLLLWVVAALAFWKGVHESHARKWRVLVGVAVGLGFVEKMAAVAVVGPLLLWLVAARLPGSLSKKEGRRDWIDGLVTSTLMLLPLGLAFREVVRIAKILPPANKVDLFTLPPMTGMPGSILMVPVVVWLLRRLAGMVFPRHPVWGVERPALETWTSILAFAPIVGWLGNPAWWRETLPRMAHYYQITRGRGDALPDIRILYFGDIYNYSLPWHNAWVLIAITVPAGILLASVVGLISRLGRSWMSSDAIPIYFALHLALWPVLRMLPTPAHDGVRLLLPTFFFLACFAGWGAVVVGDALARLVKRQMLARGLVAALVLGSASWQLAAVHPFELSYYNELIGGPRGAWSRGFELSYWYEAFDGEALDELNKLPDGTVFSFYDFADELINTPTMRCLHELGALKGTIALGGDTGGKFPDAWMLTHDSKSFPLSRLLFAMTPRYARRPEQLGKLRVVTLLTPEAASRAWALDVLTRGVANPIPPPRVPSWVRASPWLRPLGRFWGEGLSRGPTPAIDERMFEWAKKDPEGLRTAVRAVASGKPIEPGSNAARLKAFLDRKDVDVPKDRFSWRTEVLLRDRPEGLSEAVEILISRPDSVRKVLLHAGFTDERSIGGFLDQDVIAREAR